MASVIQTNDTASTTGTTDRFHTISSVASGSLLVVLVELTDNTNASMTCSDNQGGSYDLVATALWGASAHIIGCFVRTTATGAANHLVTVASGSNSGGVVNVFEVEGMPTFGSAAVRSFGKIENQTANVAPEITLSQTAITSSVMIGLVGLNSSTPSVTAPSGWSNGDGSGYTTPPGGLDTHYRDSGHTSATVTWGAAVGTGTWAAMAIELTTLLNGVLATTLDGATVVAPGTAIVHGSAAFTVAEISNASTSGTVGVSGVVATTLDGATTTASGAHIANGVVDVTLDAVTLVALNGREGAVDKTLDAVTVASDGLVSNVIRVDITLEDVAPTIEAERRNVYVYPEQIYNDAEETDLGEEDLSLF